MSAIGCNEFLNHLDGWLEGERQESARAHIHNCASCRGLVEDLATIQKTAQSLAVEAAAPEPPEHIWVSLRAQLEREGLIRHPRQGRASGLTPWLEGIVLAARGPVLAGAYMAMLVVVSFALGRPATSQINASNWARNTENETSPLTAQLDTAERDTVSYVSGANSVVAASLHENLAIVDKDITLCEKSVREDPENEAARDYLYEAYREKADLLAQMNDRDIR